MSIIEAIAVFFSLGSVILAVKSNKWCWPVGIIGILFYMVLFYQYQLWNNFGLQFIFIGQSILGIINWNKPKKEFPISWSDNWPGIILFTFLVYVANLAISNINQGSLIYLDAFTTTFSIMGMWLLAMRKINSWIFWMMADVVFVYMFFLSGLYLSSIIYVVFFVLATSGLISWMKQKKGAYDY